jgi:predicted negative regulator of RcsB-dependent stress response
VPKKKIVEELKHPDQFVDFWTHAWQRIVAVVGPRKKPAIAILVAGVVAVIGIAVLSQVDSDKRLTDSQAFAVIQQMATADLLPADDDKSAADPVAAASQKDKGKDDVHRFKTETERSTAVLTDVGKFLSVHSGSRLKAEALLLEGATLVQVARFDEATVAFKGALDSKLDDRLRFLANEGLLYAYEGKGDLDRALKSADTLIEDSKRLQGFYKDRGTYQRARLLERKGDKSGAVKLYGEVLKSVPDSPLHDTIAARLASLEAK